MTSVAPTTSSSVSSTATVTVVKCLARPTSTSVVVAPTSSTTVAEVSGTAANSDPEVSGTASSDATIEVSSTVDAVSATSSADPTDQAGEYGYETAVPATSSVVSDVQATATATSQEYPYCDEITETGVTLSTIYENGAEATATATATNGGGDDDAVETATSSSSSNSSKGQTTSMPSISPILSTTSSAMSVKIAGASLLLGAASMLHMLF